MYPGKYPTRASVQAPELTRDSLGNESSELSELGQAWVCIKPVSAYSREVISAGGERGRVTHKVTMSVPAFDVPQTAVLVANGRTFEVEVVLEGLFEAEMTLMCSEKRV